MASAFNPQSVISDVNIEAPDFGMLAKAAMSVQNRYVDGFNKYKSTINSKLNAPITSDDNKKFRTEYFKKLDGYLTNLQGIDFSNPANVAVANDLMEPLVKDPEFLADYQTTMMQNAETKKLEQIKMSTDQKVYSQYSPILERAMMYNVMDLKNAKRGDGSIMKVGVQRYVPFANLNNVLETAAKESGLKMNRVQLTNQWIIKDSFGNETIPSLTHWARQVLGNQYDEQLMITAKVQVRDQVDSLMGADPNMTREAAFQEVAKQNSAGIYQNMQEYKSSLSGGITAIDKQIRDVKSRMDNRIAKGSPEEKYIASLRKLKSDYQKEMADASANQPSKEEEMQTAFKRFMQNPEYALLPLYKDRMAKDWATSYATTHEDQDVKVNEYGLEAVKFQNDRALKLMDFEISKQLKEIDFYNDAFLKRIGGKGKDGAGGGGGEQVTRDVGGFQTIDPLANYAKFIENNKEKVFNNYLSKEVLEVASSTSDLAVNNIPYDRLRSSMEYFINNYHKPKHGANFAYSLEYKRASTDVLGYVKTVFPSADANFLSKVSPAALFYVIEAGVNKLYSGSKDPGSNAGKKYTAAKQALESAQSRLEEYMDFSSNMRAKIKALSPDQQAIINIDEFNNSGAVVLKDPTRSDARVEQLYDYLFKDVAMYNFRTDKSQTVSGFNYSGGDPKDFDFTAWGQAFQRAEYATNGVTDAQGKEAPKLDDGLAKKLRNLFGSGGANIQDFFSAEAGIFPTTLGGKEYLVVNLNTNLNDKGEIKLQDYGVTSGTVSLYIPKDKAREMWQGGTQMIDPYGRSYSASRYGELSNIVRDAFSYRPPIRWLQSGLSTAGRATFPKSMMTMYDIDDGYVAFSGTSSTAPMMVFINDGKDVFSDRIPLPMGGGVTSLTKGLYESDPTAYGELIDQALRKVLQQHKANRMKQVTSDANLHRVNYLQNPQNFTTVDDIPAA